jgi:hypothetical protein
MGRILTRSTMHTFSTTKHVRLKAQFAAGAIDVAAGDAEQTTVEIIPRHDDSRARELLERARVTCTDHADGHDVHIEIPERWTWRGRTVPFDIRVRTPAGTDMDVTTAEASFSAADAGSVNARSASGSIRIDRCRSARVSTASGRVAIGSAERNAEVNGVSGEVTVGECRTARIKTVSGDVELGRVGPGETTVHTVSGEVGIGVIPDAAVWIDTGSVSGETVSELGPGGPPADDQALVELRVKTVSGQIHLRRAATPTLA